MNVESHTYKVHKQWCMYVDIIIRIFIKNLHLKICINRERMITTLCAPVSFVRILSFIFFFSR